MRISLCREIGKLDKFVEFKGLRDTTVSVQPTRSQGKRFAPFTSHGLFIHPMRPGALRLPRNALVCRGFDNISFLLCLP